MTRTTEFYQNTLLCAATICTAALWSTQLMDEHTFDFVKNALDVDLGILRFALFIGGTSSLGIAIPVIHQRNINEKNKLNALINSIGDDAPFDHSWKHIPEVY